MSINLFKARYIPTIFIRRAELDAVKHLPGPTKDDLTPIFCLKPWATSKLLSKTIEKIEAVYGDNRQYFLDIDPFYRVEGDPKRQAQEEFLDLIDPERGSQNWTSFFDDHPNAFPCIQVVRHGAEAAISQAAEFSNREKVFLVRLPYECRENEDFLEVIEKICEINHTNFGFIIDVGWGKDILSRTAWADALVKRIVDLRGDSIPISLSGSSFPLSFTQFADGGSSVLYERQVFRNIAANNNQARLIYGDWASSRSPTEPRPNPNPIPPRVDLSCRGAWEIFRVREEDGGFPEAARQAVSSGAFPSDLDLWGTYAIRATANLSPDDPDPNIIRHHSQAAAARINLHIFTQLNHDAADAVPDTDEDFIE